MAAQTDWVKQTTMVRYKGELVEVSIREYNIMMLRGHLTPFYKHADLVINDPCLELRNEVAEKVFGSVPANEQAQK